VQIKQLSGPQLTLKIKVETKALISIKHPAISLQHFKTQKAQKNLINLVSEIRL
jgi:hypothetical protein